jgi:hypothetical protein
MALTSTCQDGACSITSTSVLALILKKCCFAALQESGSGSAPRRRESSVEEESTRRVVDLRPVISSVCLTVKPVGEPDAGNLHVRFDERGWETECCRMAQATALILDSTIV